MDILENTLLVEPYTGLMVSHSITSHVKQTKDDSISLAMPDIDSNYHFDGDIFEMKETINIDP